MDEGEKPMDIDSSDGSNNNAQPIKNNSLVVKPVHAGSSGEGLPFAPEGWPHPGDVWTWKVGKRKCAAGHWNDRSIIPPSHLKNSTGGKLIFHSKLSLEQYIRKEYPHADVGAFFSSFIWKIPAAGHIPKEPGTGSSRRLEVNGRLKSELSLRSMDCKAGNKLCREKAGSYDMATRSCNICCTEPGFCHDCSCILCSKSVDWMYGGCSFIRCEAAVCEKFVCGHVAHIDCALRAYLAGRVGGNIDLDAQYYCRCCDNKTDLLSHVSRFLKTCESLDSRDAVEKVLNQCFCILRGSEKERAKDLSNHIALIMDKLKHGVSLDEIWRAEDNISTSTAGTMPLLGNDVKILGTLDIETVDSMNWIVHENDAIVGRSEQDHENDAIVGRSEQDNLYITSDHSNASLKLEDEIDGVLQELKRTQEAEYRLAEQKLYAQKDFLLSLYQQLEVERSELANPMQKRSGNESDSLLTNVLNRVNQIKLQEAKLKEMLKISKGFGATPKTVLSEYFGLAIN